MQTAETVMESSEVNQPARLRGFIDKLMTTKEGKPRGYGYVRVPGGKHHFVHVSQFTNTAHMFKVGQWLEFTSVEGRPSPEAVDVKLIENPELCR
jgi:cold shock CspA family protein